MAKDKEKSIPSAVFENLLRILKSFKLPEFSEYKFVYSFAAVLLIFGLVTIVYYKSQDIKSPVIASQRNTPALQNDTAKIVKLRGEVFIKLTFIDKQMLKTMPGKEPSDAEWRVVQKPLDILPGTEIKTISKSDALIQFDPGTGLSLQQNSVFRVEEYTNKKQILRLNYGTVLVQVSKRKPEREFVISTPHGSCHVLGTRFLLSVIPGAEDGVLQTRLAVTNGKVKFVPDDTSKSSIIIEQGLEFKTIQNK
ncbi:MAG: FecR family protein, partial [bacterium]